MESATSLDRFAWTDENIDIATAGMRAGLSAGQIGLKLGCTRNTVIGKMTRMGIKSANSKGHQPGVPAPWKSFVKVSKPPRPNKQTVVARVAWKRPPPIPVEEPVEVPSGPPPTAKSFEELLAGECRWPYGDGTLYLFCAADVIKDRVYCGPHCRLAYQPTARLTKLREKYEVAA